VDDDYEVEFDEYDPQAIYPEPFSKWVLIKAGIDFASHILDGARCALGIVAQGVLASEIFHGEQKSFEESVRASLEMLPEAEGDDS
jgi:hypothetical protein